MMKHILLIGFIFTSITLFAQTPQKYNYQAVARDASGNPIANTQIGLRITVRQASASGTSVYQETHLPTTNQFGLFSIEIGTGTVVSGAFNAIGWGSNAYYQQVELDPNGATGGLTYTNMGATQLISVPYALYAKEAGTAPPDADNDPTNEIQTLGLSGSTLSLSNGGGSVNLPTGTTYTAGSGISIVGNAISNTAPNQAVTLTGGGTTSISGTYPNFTVTTPAEVDGSTTNEIQTLGLSGSTLSLSNGGGSVTLPAEVDGSTTNEIQTLGLSGSTLSLSNGGGSVNLPTYTAGSGINIVGNAISNAAPDQTVTLTGGGATSISGSYPNFTVTTPTSADNDPTNEIQILGLSGSTLSLSNGGGSVTLPSSNGWNLTGNADTDPATNFVGTTDDQPLKFRVNNQPAGEISETNAALGNLALQNNTSGSLNTAMGRSALANNITGNENTAAGSFALTSNNTGIGNAAFGSNALLNNTAGGYNTAIGGNALRSATTADNNVAVGYSALDQNTAGVANVAVGSYALENNTTGIANTAIGNNALRDNTTGIGNIAIGGALGDNTTGNSNIGIGGGALQSNTTGSNNVSIGRDALPFNTTGYSNVAIGISALFNNTNRSNIVAIGDSALFNNGLGANFYDQAIKNVAVGSKALYSNTTGRENTAIGYEALKGNTTGPANTANGYQSLFYNTTGYSNTAVGYQSLYYNTIGWHNVAIGLRSLFSNTTGEGNVAIGSNALAINESGIDNSAVGVSALYQNTTGYVNTANGVSALYSNTTGHHNTAIGWYALGAFFATNCTYSTAVGTSSGPTSNYINSISIGHDSHANGTDRAEIGSTFMQFIGGYKPWSNLSDGRFKHNVKGNVPGLDFILKLKPVTYQVDYHAVEEQKGIEPFEKRLHPRKEPDGIETAITDEEIKNARQMQVDKEKSMAIAEAKIQSGFIAQDVLTAAQQLGYDFDGVNKPQHDKDHYSLAYSQFVVPLVKAVQEQQEMIEQQNKTIADLLKRIEQLEAK